MGTEWHSVHGIPLTHQDTLMARFNHSLAEYLNALNLTRAVTDAFKATEHLSSIGSRNRNTSLALEEPMMFTDALEGNKVGPPEVVQDLDTAELVNYPSEDQTCNSDQYRIGTPPYMSINVLLGRSEYHEPCDDMQSVFYAAYLFAFTYNGPVPTTYPS
ncbi:hypothetical protein L227DRAFT_270342 [Lentinus tigrinus ALCF2SS1-6]|uniref:Fungal-type protein kinase domain-containing protein n=1 Tax=Lentinus tigrinus ALCF2SS1-6 TaxID=1328759 RepID=A0A5C2SLY4_9APHY|nr:hypothetical protein L227DRAFT_270342 [Lentinus tigrinus ALCF2SS1-6]